MRNVPCGTDGGVMVYFEKIEVVNRLEKKEGNIIYQYYFKYRFKISFLLQLSTLFEISLSIMIDPC